jgi:hypothetical protein
VWVCGFVGAGAGLCECVGVCVYLCVDATV